MTLFQASSPTDQVAGASVRAMVEAMGRLQAFALKALAEQGITDPMPGQWYPWQAYLEAMHALYKRTGPNTLAVIGRQLVAGHAFPAHLDTLDKALGTLDADYRMRHRGRELGAFLYEREDRHTARLTITNPYPCELDRGVVQEICRKFPTPATGLPARVVHGPECRHKGADRCVLTIAG